MDSILRRMLQSLIFILFSVWILLSLLTYFFQPKFIYFPYSTLEATPKDIGLEYADVTLVTSDDQNINGWFVSHPSPRATLLFLHGNGGNISHRLEKLSIFHQLGLAVFIIDYRGYGLSTGNPSEQGTYLDAEAAWNYLVKDKTIPENNIIIYGESLGGAVAVWLTTRYQSQALIVESPFTSITDIGRHYYPYLPVKLLTRIKYPSDDRIKYVHCPILFVHSPFDDIVPYKFGRRLFLLANEPKSFLDIVGDHNGGFSQSGDIYINGLDKFLRTFVNI